MSGAPIINLQQHAALSAVICPTCGLKGTQTPVYAIAVGGDQVVLFCLACLLPKLAELSPPMCPVDQLPPTESVPETNDESP
jgi:hypothetical protein